MSDDRLIGTVTDFDFAVGLGHLSTSEGETRLFHCVEIADGTRNIEVGSRVSFLAVTRFGHQEAADLRVV